MGFALDINRMEESRFRGFKLAPYGGGTLRAVGFGPSAIKRCQFSELEVHGYHECFRGEGFEDTNVSDFLFDCDYNEGAGEEGSEADVAADESAE